MLSLRKVKTAGEVDLVLQPTYSIFISYISQLCIHLIDGILNIFCFMNNDIVCINYLIRSLLEICNDHNGAKLWNKVPTMTVMLCHFGLYIYLRLTILGL